MKKIFSIVLIIATLLVMSGCFLDPLSIDRMPGDARDELSFYASSGGDSLTFSIGTTYTTLDRGSYTELYFDHYYVMIDPFAFSSITPNEGYPFPTLEEFFKFSVLREGESTETDGQYTYVNRSTDEKTNYSFFLESENSFWWVEISLSTEHATHEAAFESFKELMGKITIVNASEQIVAE